MFIIMMKHPNIIRLWAPSISYRTPEVKLPIGTAISEIALISPYIPLILLISSFDWITEKNVIEKYELNAPIITHAE